METVQHFLDDMNHLSGAFLLIIAFGVSSCASALHAIKRDVECLHEDYDRVTQAHNILHEERRASRPEWS